MNKYCFYYFDNKMSHNIILIPVDGTMVGKITSVEGKLYKL